MVYGVWRTRMVYGVWRMAYTVYGVCAAWCVERAGLMVYGVWCKIYSLYCVGLQRRLRRPRVVLPARTVDVRLPEKGNSNSHGARPIITMIVDSDQ